MKKTFLIASIMLASAVALDLVQALCDALGIGHQLGIREGHEISLPVMQYDTPAIIADILGLRIPADWRGRPFPEIYTE